MNGKHIVGKYVVALVSLVAAGTVLAQDATPQAPTTGQLSRAEVIADLNLWKRVGLQAYTNRGDSYEFFNPAYERALAEYQRLRNGPEYLAEVRRVANERGETLAGTVTRSAQ